MAEAWGRAVRRVLALLHLSGVARAVKRTLLLSVDGVRAMVRRQLLGDVKSPKVTQELSELSLPAIAGDHDTYLRSDNPKLLELYQRYGANTPFEEIVSPRWHDVGTHADLRNFRSHGDFLWTRELQLRYRMTARYVRRMDRLNLLRLLGEDEAFGEPAIQVGGIRLSRDKLDSVLEIYYLIDRLGLSVHDRFSVLDIGAGYGRLAHRLTSVFKRCQVYCVDAIPLSTFLSEFYLRYRKAENAHVVAFDELDSLPRGQIDFAVSVHSFPEQTRRSVEFWLDFLDRLDVKRLAIVDHNGQWLTMEPPDNRRSRYFPVLGERGWVMVDCRPKYTTFMGNLFGIYPEAVYALFARA